MWWRWCFSLDLRVVSFEIMSWALRVGLIWVVGLLWLFVTLVCVAWILVCVGFGLFVLIVRRLRECIGWLGFLGFACIVWVCLISFDYCLVCLLVK